MKVIDWISNDAAEGKPEAPIGGLGGWFGFRWKTGESVNHTWADYIAMWKEPARPYAEALRDAIVAGRIWECGDWHQSESCTGVPLFEDGTVATFSFRAWGDLLAAVWTEQLGRSYCYMDFYYATPPVKPPDFEARGDGRESQRPADGREMTTVKIADLIEKMQRWEDHVEERDGTCVKCGETIGGSEPEHEPSPLCNACAQDLATRSMPERIQRLETELARAAGVVRAHGEHDYADDYMRVAQDREDFDAEVSKP